MPFQRWEGELSKEGNIQKKSQKSKQTQTKINTFLNIYTYAHNDFIVMMTQSEQITKY